VAVKRGKQGTKRKSMASSILSPPTPSRKSRRYADVLTIDNYRPRTIGTRVLSCGEGEQIGHPGRTVTRKPRAVDTFPEGTEFVQVIAGGVHSLVLTITGTVYSCGINEKGTVPVVGLSLEETTDKFTEIAFSSDINKLGKIVQITAGASFSAALTEEGSVIAWGNLRDTQGELSIKENKTLNKIKEAPVVVFNHKKAEKRIVKITAGENHLAMLSERGEILTLGEGSMGQLGRSLRTKIIRSCQMVGDTGASLIIHVLERGKLVFFVDVWAKGFWTMARAEDGRIFACGLNNFGQLGMFDKIEPRSRKSGSRSRMSEISVKPRSSPSGFDACESIPSGSEAHSQNNGIKNSNKNSSDIMETISEQSKNGEKMDYDKDSQYLGEEQGSMVALLSCANSFTSLKTWTHFAGIQHLICRSQEGEIFGIGKNTDNALGIGTWINNDDQEHWRYDSLQEIILPDSDKALGLDATLGASIIWTQTGKVYAFGCDTVGQLGLGIKDDDDKIVPTPKLVSSAHLEDYDVISASISDNHTLFLAAKKPSDKIINGSLH